MTIGISGVGGAGGTGAAIGVAVVGDTVGTEVT